MRQTIGSLNTRERDYVLSCSFVALSCLLACLCAIAFFSSLLIDGLLMVCSFVVPFSCLFLSLSPFVVWSCGSFRIRLGCRPERPRCVGESLRDECAQASLLSPRQRREQHRIRLRCRPEGPRCVGEVLRTECAQASLHRPRQGREQHRIRPGCRPERPCCVGELLCDEFTYVPIC